MIIAFYIRRISFDLCLNIAFSQMVGKVNNAINTILAHSPNVRIQSIALSLGLLLMGAKFLAWWWTNSNAILTDALESIINVVAGALALYSLVLASKPKDKNHPYGHGKVEFISAGFEGGLIALSGLGIIGKASYNLLHPQAIEALEFGLIITVVTGLANLVMGWLLARHGRRSHSLTLVASGKHLMTDAWSSAGLVAGLIAILLTGQLWLDNLIAIGFGLFILVSGYRLVRQSLAGIMDEADYELLEGFAAKLESERREDWIDVHNLRVIAYGADLHFDCHLTLPWYYDTQTAHDQVKALESVLVEGTERAVEVFVHIDPCRPPSDCSLCSKADCTFRQANQEHRIVWSLERLMMDQPHHLNTGPDH